MLGTLLYQRLFPIQALVSSVHFLFEHCNLLQWIIDSLYNATNILKQLSSNWMAWRSNQKNERSMNCYWMFTTNTVPWFQRFIFIIFIAKGRWKINLWLKAAIDSSSRANQFELGSDPDSVSWLDDWIKALWLIQIKHL
jgi:hypothetical protein